jgi:hypothetical protein
LYLTDRLAEQAIVAIFWSGFWLFVKKEGAVRIRTALREAYIKFSIADTMVLSGLTPLAVEEHFEEQYQDVANKMYSAIVARMEGRIGLTTIHRKFG